MKARFPSLGSRAVSFSIALMLTLPACEPGIAAVAALGGSYELDAQVVAAGGAPLSGPNAWASDVTVGQNNTAQLAGANEETAQTGFWEVAVRGGASDRVFQSGFEVSGP